MKPSGDTRTLRVPQKVTSPTFYKAIQNVFCFYRRWWLRESKYIFPHFWRLGVPDQGASQSGSWWTLFSCLVEGYLLSVSPNGGERLEPISCLLSLLISKHSIK